MRLSSSPPPLIDKRSSRGSTGESDVVERLLAAGAQYKQHRSELVHADIAATSFTPAISATSRKLAGNLPPLHQRAVALARDRETRLQLQMDRQDERLCVMSARKVTAEEAATKARDFALWQERKKLRVEESKKKIEASEAAACPFRPKLRSRGKENTGECSSFEQRMEEDADRRKQRMEQLKESAQLRELKECKFRPSAPALLTAASKRRSAHGPLQPVPIQSMSLDEIFSLVQ